MTTYLAEVDPIRGAALLTSYCLALMQNVPTEEQVKAKDALKQIAADESIDKDIRLDLIALELSKIVGPAVLEAAISALGARLQKAEKPAASGEPISQAEVLDQIDKLRSAKASQETPAAGSNPS